MNKTSLSCGLVIAVFGFVADALGSADSIGAFGINSIKLAVSGINVGIGQVETGRPGDPDFDTIGTLFHMAVDPEQVFYLNAFDVDATMDDATEVTNHAVEVAGVMISTDPVATGVATSADLYSIGGIFGPNLSDVYEQVAHNAQHIAKLATQEVWAINMSINASAGGQPPNGNSLLTQFVDWSARTHEVLYVVAGFEIGGSGPIPSDNFNGITVASSSKPMDEDYWRQVDISNSLASDGNRTFVDLIAPGRDVVLATTNSALTVPPHPIGTSIAAPHVTGTVALLQEYADTQIMNGQPRWGANALRHEVMKAVLMNSADKLEDSGNGFRLGMSRTVLKRDGISTWLDSDAYNATSTIANADFIPLDLEMGAGHLNASRALQQFSSGEHDAVDAFGTVVPQIGWDYANTSDTGAFYNEYVFMNPLPEGSFVSITLAWDRIVSLDIDSGTTGEYDFGDTFEVAGDFDEGFNDLEIYLLPKDSATIDEAIARSISQVSNLEHIFFQIPTTGMYEFWVYEDQTPVSLNGTDYAVAWWAFDGPAGPPVSGDYDGNGSIGPEDYNLWQSQFGMTVAAGTGADGNGDGIVNAADYVVWRNNFEAAGSGASSLARVPEPTTFGLVTLMASSFLARRCSKSWGLVASAA